MGSVEFKDGDIVKLKSGGPRMTYSGADQLGDAICVWFDKDGNPQSRTFNPEVLEPYKETKASLGMVGRRR